MDYGVVVLIALLGLTLAALMLVARHRARRSAAVRQATARLREALARAAAPMPELLAVIGEYVAFERAVFTEARRAAEGAAAASGPEALLAARGRLAAAAADLFAIVEVYPDLTTDAATASQLQALERGLEDADTAGSRLAKLLDLLPEGPRAGR